MKWVVKIRYTHTTPEDAKQRRENIAKIMARNIKKQEPATRNDSPVGGTISKSVGPHYTNYIHGLIESGRYQTVAEVLREALRLHEKVHRTDTIDDLRKPT